MPGAVELLLRLDAVLVPLLVGASLWTVQRWLARAHGIPGIGRDWIGAVCAVALLVPLAAERFDADERGKLRQMLEAHAPTYATALRQLGLLDVGPDTSPDDPTYLRLIAVQLEWLSLTTAIADVYTFARDRDGRVVLVVDSETDYDRDGRLLEAREQRTPIGEPFDATPAVERAFAGELVFEDAIYMDRWGTWVSEFAPVRDEGGEVRAVVGVDFPAADWIERIAAARLRAVLGGLIALGGLLGGRAIALVSHARIASQAELAVRERTERALREAADAAASANRAKSTFLASVSHEIRTPLNAVLGFARLLLESPLGPQQLEWTRTLADAGASLLRLVSDVLDLAKIEAGRLELERGALDLRAELASLVGLLKASADEKGLALRLAVDASVPPWLVGDAARVRQIALNLVGNAIKFTPAGFVEVTASASEPRAGVVEVCIAVRDTGIGIARELRPRLFRPFEQADASTTRRFGGTGLGLAISAELARCMHGRIDLESAPGLGSTFRFEAPFAIAVAVEAVSPPTGERDAAALAIPILVVEDFEPNRRLVRVLLQRLGARVEVACDGAEAIERAEQEPYALILMDLQMPNVDGVEAARAIRAGSGPNRDAPIVALTANALGEDRERCFAAGMTDFVTKPIEPIRLESVVRRWARKLPDAS